VGIKTASQNSFVILDGLMQLVSSTQEAIFGVHKTQKKFLCNFHNNSFVPYLPENGFMLSRNMLH
jgi:hypothetical protein